MHAGCSPSSGTFAGIFGTTKDLGNKRQTDDDADEEPDASKSLSQIAIIDGLVNYDWRNKPFLSRCFLAGEFELSNN